MKKKIHVRCPGVHGKAILALLLASVLLLCGSSVCMTAQPKPRWGSMYIWWSAAVADRKLTSSLSKNAALSPCAAWAAIRLQPENNPGAGGLWKNHPPGIISPNAWYDTAYY